MNARRRLSLQRDLAALGRTLHRGRFYRNVRVTLLQTPFALGGNLKHGGRYNRSERYEPGTFAALYLCDNPANSLMEVEAIIDGIPQAFVPRALLTIDVDLHDVVDLRYPAPRRKICVTLEELRLPWRVEQKRSRTITQEIGAAARSLGIEGLLVPSAKIPGAFNLVVIVENMRQDSNVVVYVEDGIPAPGQVIRGSIPTS